MQPNPVTKRLRDARLRAKLSQKQLGVLAGLDENSASARMNQYEKGKHNPDIELLRRIGKVLNVPLSYFFCEDDITAEIICHIDHLSDNDKNDLLEYIKGKSKNSTDTD